MFKSFKYRIYPNKEQSVLLDKHFGCCRFIYNLALETKVYAYTTARKQLSAFDLIKQIPLLKEDAEWLKEVSHSSLQQSILNLETAFKMFRKSNMGFPKYKNRNSRQSFRSPRPDRIKIDFDENHLYLPKFKSPIKIIFSRRFKGELRSVTIIKETTGKYYASILTDTKKDAPQKNPIIDPDKCIGIDLGIKSLIVTSDGTKVDNPKFLSSTLRRISILQNRLRNKKKGSKNKLKQYRKIALLYEKASFQRRDFMHKLTSELIKNHDTICFESLSMSNLSANRKISRAIYDASWGMLVGYCTYKADWYGKNILQIGRFEPSSKICNVCGAKNISLGWADREWLCVECGTSHDRDINAAINIKNIALRDLGRVPPGEPVELPALSGTVKQEYTNV